MNSTDELIKVVYIAGYGRSGSTLLTNLLGQIDGFFSVGELTYIWSRGIQNNELCSCGKPFKECPFWSQVISNFVKKNIKYGDFEYIAKLHNSVARGRYAPLLNTKKYSFMFSEFWNDVEEYLMILGDLYSAIFNQSNGSVIVDASKTYVFGKLLSFLPNSQLHVVHLIRDSRAVAYSLSKLKPRVGSTELMARRDPVKSALEWNIYNLASSMLGQGNVDSYTFIRYEDFVNEPTQYLQKIVNVVDRKYLEGIPEIKNQSINLQVMHTVSGNPMRFKKLIEIREDRDWEKNMLLKDKKMVSMLTFPFLKRYGY